MTMGWGGFILAFALFFVSHSIPVRPPVRPWLVERLGAKGFGAAYSALSLGVLTWLIIAAGRAPFVPLWDWALWQVHFALALMFVACLIVGLAIARPNPFSFGGARNGSFDPARPGIIRLTRHPLLAALALWSLAHLMVNGDLAHVILFGTFALFSAFGMRLVDRRKRREMGDHWPHLAQEVRARPLHGALGREDVLRLALGLALYGALLAAHVSVIGVDPLAPI